MGVLKNRGLRVAVFNVENLFVLMDREPAQAVSTISEDAWQRLSTSIIPNKPMEQIIALARAVKDMRADVLMMCEVGGIESLRNFNRHFLDDEYVPYLIEGNSDRGIDIGYLMKKALPVKVDLISHKQRPIDFLYPHEKQTKETGYTDRPSGRLTSHRFSRDVLELRLFEEDETDPSLVCLLVHLKSQLDRDRIDPQGRDRRKAELEKLVQIFKEIENEFGGRVPVIIGGDFNGLASLPNPDPEFQALYRDTSLKDALEIAGRPMEERFTFMQISAYVPTVSRQLDYLFVPQGLAAKLIANESFVYRFKDEFGMAMTAPRTLPEKRLLPSDHYPVIATFSAL